MNDSPRSLLPNYNELFTNLNIGVKPTSDDMMSIKSG